jgi:hypothetical protein
MWLGDTPSLNLLPRQITWLYAYYNFVISRAQEVFKPDVNGDGDEASW